MSKVNVYEIVTERILAELEKGNIPWKKPWIRPTVTTNDPNKQLQRSRTNRLLCFPLYLLCNPAHREAGCSLPIPPAET